MEGFGEEIQRTGWFPFSSNCGTRDQGKGQFGLFQRYNQTDIQQPFHPSYSCLSLGYILETNKDQFEAPIVVSSLPIESTVKLLNYHLKNTNNESSPSQHPLVPIIQPYLQANESKQGGGIVLFLGVPEPEIIGAQQHQDAKDEKEYGFRFTHHQLLQSHELPLGNGNNMFISVSSPGDLESAPAGHRAVMISTHTEVKEWVGNPSITSMEEYRRKKEEIGNKLIDYARRVYPDLGKSAVVSRFGTPRTYARFTR